MKYVFALLLLISFKTFSQPETFDYSPTIHIDSSKGYVVKHISRKYDIDSSGWWLYKVEGDTDHREYYYFKLFSYGIMQNTEYPPDSIEAWSKNLSYYARIMQFGDYSDCVAYMEKIHCKSKMLFAGCTIKDTVPTIEFSVELSDDRKKWIYRKNYYVGGFRGEFIRSEIESVTPTTKEERAGIVVFKPSTDSLSIYK